MDAVKRVDGTTERGVKLVQWDITSAFAGTPRRYFSELYESFGKRVA
jgi:hypothetical protein